MHAGKSQSVLVLFLIGWESGVSFLNQSENITTITFETDLKTALLINC